MDKVREHEVELTEYALDIITKVKGVTLYGPRNTEDRGGVISFNIGDIHPHDLATIMNDHGVAIRSVITVRRCSWRGLTLRQHLGQVFISTIQRRKSISLFSALEEARRIFKI